MQKISHHEQNQWKQQSANQAQEDPNYQNSQIQHIKLAFEMFKEIKSGIKTLKK